MKKYPYSGEKIFAIYSQLHKRGLAMFLGYQNGQPMIWMDSRDPLARAPISIATADVLLEEILTRELEGCFNPEVLVGEVLDAIALPERRQPRRVRRVVALLSGSL